MSKPNIGDIRKDYRFDGTRELNEKNVHADAIKQFELWFHEALDKDELEANVMFLATCSGDCKPSIRTVLLKAYDEGGFVFYTNYTSRKGIELTENPFASLLFFWKDLNRQVRIEGSIEMVSREDSEEYFHRRPFDSQIAATCSEQSKVIKNREEIENKFIELKEKYRDSVVPLPEFWGGYRLIPESIEFWQGRQNRMHDRLVYTKDNSRWKIERLSP